MPKMPCIFARSPYTFAQRSPMIASWKTVTPCDTGASAVMQSQNTVLPLPEDSLSTAFPSTPPPSMLAPTHSPEESPW